jgi:hypothetical protein
MNNPNGFTQKELLLEVIANQKKFDDKLSGVANSSSKFGCNNK